MIYTYGNRKYQLDDDAITNLMTKLKCSKMEAVQVYLQDSGILDEAKEAAELDRKAAKNKPNHGVAIKKSAAARPRKENPEKAQIIAEILPAVQKFDANAAISKAEREISFKIGDNSYSLVLTLHRNK